MNATNDPHQNQYLAAVQGMRDTYGWREAKSEPAVGDWVSGRTAGKAWSGRVEWIENDHMTLDVGGGWVSVPVKDITH